MCLHWVSRHFEKWLFRHKHPFDQCPEMLLVKSLLLNAVRVRGLGEQIAKGFTESTVCALHENSSSPKRKLVEFCEVPTTALKCL